MPPVNQEAGRIGIEIVNACRRWAHSRAKCRRLLDSKKASPHDVEAARKTYLKASDEMEAIVGRLEAVMRLSGLVVPMHKRPVKPFPWKPLITVAADFTKALADAINNPQQHIEAQVIDVTPEPPGDSK